jgi:murein DD-endopeptidase MepM/ murein hydrolase activator NlpD
MESMFRWLLVLVVVIALGVTGAFVVAGRGGPPLLTINKPDRVIGQASALDVTAQAPNARFTTLTVTVEQNGHAYPLFALDPSLTAGNSASGATVTQINRNQLRITGPLGKRSVPDLTSGAARVIVTATRPSFLNLRTLTSTATRDLQVRLEPPRIAVVSSHHYVNHGGSEMVVYRVTPPDVASGVRVGDIEYPGFPTGGDPSVKAAFFALLFDQDLNTPINAFARDEAGNEAKVTFVDNVFEKPQRRSRIELDDKFIDRVVPEIIEHSPEMKMAVPTNGDEMIAGYLRLNGELRRKNAAEIAAFAKKTAPTRLWNGPFVQLGNSKVEAAFADHRTYFYKGKEVDQQVHLGFDLAVTEHVPVLAANDGIVLNASWLGIYGNCVVIDHGQGVQSLYGHLMSFDVKVGDKVKRGQQIGRSDSTGLAGGDHLHFTMLIGGQMVNPVEWWDPHWIADRVDRKLQEASGSATGR